MPEEDGSASGEGGNLSAVQSISAKLLEVTRLAEKLDARLCEAGARSQARNPVDDPAEVIEEEEEEAAADGAGRRTEEAGAAAALEILECDVTVIMSDCLWGEVVRWIVERKVCVGTWVVECLLVLVS